MSTLYYITKYSGKRRSVSALASLFHRGLSQEYNPRTGSFQKWEDDRGLFKEYKDLETLHEWRIQCQGPKSSFYKKKWPRGSRIDYSSKTKKKKIIRD